MAQPVPAFDTKLVPADRPPGGLGQALFLGLLALAEEIGQTVPEIAPDRAPTGSEAAAIMSDLFGHLFPEPSGLDMTATEGQRTTRNGTLLEKLLGSLG